MADIYANTPMFWAFLLNHVMFGYFILVRGCALGIKQTINQLNVLRGIDVNDK